MGDERRRDRIARRIGGLALAGALAQGPVPAAALTVSVIETQLTSGAAAMTDSCRPSNLRRPWSRSLTIGQIPETGLAM